MTDQNYAVVWNGAMKQPLAVREPPPPRPVMEYRCWRCGESGPLMICPECKAYIQDISRRVVATFKARREARKRVNA